MPNLYALITGINIYPGNIPNLNGCLADAQTIDEYLEGLADTRKWDYHPLRLMDAAASRKNIIAAFTDHFQQAQNGDFCVWHYSGHGALSPAPEEFWWYNTDKQHRGIVCADSRGPNAQGDLLDKEISWLLWKATHEKNITFLAITDCCYASSNFRHSRQQVRLANAGAPTEHKSLSAYLGYEDYDRQPLRWSPPRGRYIQLAAAQPDQPALEKFFIGKGARGIFTTALLMELQQSSRLMNYLELHKRTQTRVAGMTPQQLPQIDYFSDEQLGQLFLSDDAKKHDSLHWLYFKLDKNHWRINAGGLLGVQLNKDGVYARINDQQIKLKLQRVNPGYSVVNISQQLDTKKIYPVDLPVDINKAIVVDFHASISNEIREKIVADFNPNLFEFACLANNKNPATHWFRMNTKEALIFSLLEEESALFMRQKADNLRLLWQDVEKVGRWTYLLQLENPNTSIRANDLAIELYRLPEGADFNANQLIYSREWTKELKVCFKPGGINPETGNRKYHIDRFAIKVTNRGRRTLVVKTLNLSNDFEISTEFRTSNNRLNPGESSWVNVVTLEREYPILQVNLKYAANLFKYASYTHYLEYFKFIVATEEIEMHQFAQSAIPLPFRLRGAGNDQELNGIKINRSDWTTFQLPVQVDFLPVFKELKSLHTGRQQIEHDTKGQAIKAMLISAESLPRLYDLPRRSRQFPPDGLFAAPLAPRTLFTDNPSLYLWELGFNRSAGPSVLLVQRGQNTPKINEHQPLKIIIPFTPKEIAKGDRESVRPFGYSATNQKLTPLPYRQYSDNAGEVYEITGLGETVQLKDQEKNLAAILVFCFVEEID